MFQAWLFCFQDFKNWVVLHLSFYFSCLDLLNSFYLNLIENISRYKKTNPFSKFKISLNDQFAWNYKADFFSSSSDQTASSFNTLYDRGRRPNVEKKPALIYIGHLNSGGPCSQLYYGIGVEFFLLAANSTLKMGAKSDIHL